MRYLGHRPQITKQHFRFQSPGHSRLRHLSLSTLGLDPLPRFPYPNQLSQRLSHHQFPRHRRKSVRLKQVHQSPHLQVNDRDRWMTMDPLVKGICQWMFPVLPSVKRWLADGPNQEPRRLVPQRHPPVLRFQSLGPCHLAKKHLSRHQGQQLARLHSEGPLVTLLAERALLLDRVRNPETMPVGQLTKPPLVRNPAWASGVQVLAQDQPMPGKSLIKVTCQCKVPYLVLSQRHNNQMKTIP